MADSPAERDVSRSRSGRVNVFFRLAALFGAAFVFTILALVASVYSDSESPAVHFLNEQGGRLIAVEVAATLVCGFLAMRVDRLRWQRGEVPREEGRVTAVEPSEGESS